MSDVVPKITCLLTDFLERWWEKYDRDLKSTIPTPYGIAGNAAGSETQNLLHKVYIFKIRIN